MSFRLLCIIVILLAPRLVSASDPGNMLGACRLDDWSAVERWRQWNTHSPRRADWAEEKSRYETNPEVWRWYDRLYISVDNGKVLVLADCSFDDNTHYYEYVSFDEPGGFHVVHLWRYEAHSYVLVMRNTGEIYGVPGPPQWSPDAKRFAYAECTPPDGSTDLGDVDVGIFAIEGDRLKMEAKAEMPCSGGTCKLEWTSDEAVNVVCEDFGNGGGKSWTMRLTRRDFGWASRTSNE